MRWLPKLTLGVFAALLMFSGPARGADYRPAFTIFSLTAPTNFAPGDASGNAKYDLRVLNIGGAATSAPVTITDTLPAGLTVHSVSLRLRSNSATGNSEYAPEACTVDESGESPVVTCEISAALPGSVEPEVLQPAEQRRVIIQVDTPNPPGGSLSLTNQVAVQGGNALPASATFHNEVNAKPAAQGIAYSRIFASESDGTASSQAGSHPYQLVTSFAVNTAPAPPAAANPFVPAGGDVKNSSFTLPSGLVGNVPGVAKCTQQQFSTTRSVQVGSGAIRSFFTGNDCPDSSAIGVVELQQGEGEPLNTIVPLYNLVPPPGMPAEFGSQLLNLPFYITTEVRPDDHYRVVATLRNLTQIKRLTAATTLIWGTPADPAHDSIRGSCLNEIPEIFPPEMPTCDRQEEPAPYLPFLRMPTRCGAPLQALFGFDNWTVAESFVSEESDLPALSGCEQVKFEPKMQVRPTSNTADSPTGLHANVHIPQGEDSQRTGQADLRKTVVQLPPGLAINPSSANGLKACSVGEVGLTSGPAVVPWSFNASPATCPAAARVGTATVRTPLIDHPLEGGVYVATPYANPFGSLLAIYVTINDPLSGVVVKIPGEVRPDPATGQLTATFDETPQTPFEDFELDFPDGPLAALRTSPVCGAYTVGATLTPWSAPGSGPPVEISDPFSITQSPTGGACPTSAGALPNSPEFSAGSTVPTAGSYKPFVLHLRRNDGSQEFSSLTVTPPPGLLAKLAGIPYCPEAALAAAGSSTGSAEKAVPSCPAASQVGTVTAAVGAGPAPYYAEGKGYLAGPYKGAPLSLAVVTPALAGPFDLGTIVVRTALFIDPETATVRAASDKIPSILQGIPLDVRSVTVRLDRPGFALNPTTCEELHISGQEISTLGQAAALGDRFQLEGCGGLRVAPRLSISLRGGTRRDQNPALKAVLTNPPGSKNANLRSARVSLPHSLFLANDHFRTICTRVRFAAGTCPKGSIYGRARAFTPLLDKALRGPVYLRSSSHPLPDLVADLNGQVHIIAVGRIDSVKGRIRSTFGALPDAPVSKFVLELVGGKHGILVNSANLCHGVRKATAVFAGHNQKTSELRPLVKPRCPH